MVINFTVHESWISVPHALSRIMATLAALEHPRQPGDDLSDLGELLDGINDPEPAPAAPAVAKPSPAPSPAATPRTAKPSFDGAPVTGPQLYKFACNHKALPTVNRLAKSHGFGRRIVDLTPDEVAILYRELTAEPSANGRPH
jgi:hypothetical protein